MPKYFWNYLVLFSQTINVILGGDPDESVSQRTARAYMYFHRYFPKHWKYKLFTLLKNSIDLIFWNKIWKIEKDHTLRSINGERGAGQVWDWNKK